MNNNIVFIINQQKSIYFRLFPPLCRHPWFFLDVTFFRQTPPLFSVTQKYH